MKNKRYKVNRYEYEWGGQRKLWWKRVLSTALIVVVAGAIGWFGYEPVYNLVMGVQHEPPAADVPSSEAPSSLSQSESPSETPQPEVTAEEGLPKSNYYLSPEIIQNTAMLDAELAKIKASGGTGVTFDLKDDMGNVLYRSALPEVEQYLVQSESPYDLAEVIVRIKAAGLTPVGRLFAFKDAKVTSSTAMSEAGVKYMDSKISWLDNAKADGGKPWLNPNSPLAREYILKLTGEVTTIGLDYIILDGVQFPTGLSLHLATFGGEPNRSQLLGDFVAEAAKLAEQQGASIYPVITLDAAVGLNDIMYGTSPDKLVTAAGGAIVDLRPEQFGMGVTSDKLTLAKPLQTPYEALTTALAVAEGLTKLDGVSLCGMVQCYTSAAVESTANLAYGKAEIAAQVKAASEAGIERVLYYNPQGRYE